MKKMAFYILIALISIVVCWTNGAYALDQQPGWAVPSSGEVKKDLEKWLDAGSTGTTEREKSLAPWNLAPGPGTGLELYNTTLDSLRVSPEVDQFMKSCDNFEWEKLPFGKEVKIPELPKSLQDENAPMRLADTLRLYLAHRLIRAHLYDEAGSVLDTLKPENSLDPAAVLISKSIVFNRLLEKEKGLAALDEFKSIVEQEIGTPRRYPELAKLLEDELQSLKEDEDDLDNVGRRMADVQRRLGTGKTGEKVQEVEEGILKSLDRVIDRLQKQCQGQGDGEGNNLQSRAPGQTERIMRGTGPGNVENKNIGNQDGWGDLPPKQREEALLKIEKEFPSHYRDVIQEYFREMAGIEEN